MPMQLDAVHPRVEPERTCVVWAVEGGVVTSQVRSRDDIPNNRAVAAGQRR